MDDFHTVVQRLSSDPVVWSRVQAELEAAQDRRRRFVELAREQGLSIELGAVDQGVLASSRELGEDELASVSGGATPGPPNLYSGTAEQEILIGLLLPAVQKAR